MMPINQEQILTLFTLTILIIATCNAIRYRKRYNSLEKQHSVVLNENETLTSNFVELKEKESRHLSFAADLSQAEITTRLQTSRLDQQTNALASSPERYNYVGALTESGMGPENIANLLSISAQEAEQLVTLSRIACRH